MTDNENEKNLNILTNQFITDTLDVIAGYRGEIDNVPEVLKEDREEAILYMKELLDDIDEFLGIISRTFEDMEK